LFSASLRIEDCKRNQSLGRQARASPFEERRRFARLWAGVQYFVAVRL
jgi:hypothetical protein